MIRLPIENQWSQPNTSDKFGSVWYTKNITFDERGYLKLSPRAVKVMDDVEDNDFGFPVAIGRHATGQFQVATASDANFSADIAVNQNTFTQDTGTNEPTLTADSDGIWFSGLWHVSTATAVLSKAAPTSSANYTSRITGLTSGVQHQMTVFSSRNSICVSNGNVIKQYNASYANTTDLTIPSDYEIVGMAYNNSRLAIITRLTNDGSDGQDQECRFFLWDGATTAANLDAGTGSDAIVGIIAYKSSFLILTREGELLYWNGGGFERLDAFPFFFDETIYGDVSSNNALGNVPMVVDGDRVYFSIGIELNVFGIKQERRTENTPSGIWCYDPNVGLYHRYSPSLSSAYVNYVAGATINTSTDTLVASAGVFGLETIPATGGIARLTSTVGIGGLKVNHDYYIIRVSSTDFKLATTRENALNGDAIDITSATAGDNYFWMYDLIDYGCSYYGAAGAIALVASTNNVSEGVLFGARLDSTAFASTDSLHLTVPFLENRGYVVLPKIYPNEVEDNTQKLIIKYRPLGTNDKIIVKSKNRDVYNVTMSSTGVSAGAEWTSPTELFITGDFSEAKTFKDAGGHLEMEILSGAGAGTMAQVVSIDEDNGVYSFVLDEPVLGASSGLQSHFILNNWEVIHTITNDDTGYAEVPLAKKGKWLLLKLELRGYNTTIEELGIVNNTFKKS